MKLAAASRRGALTPALPMPYEALGKLGLRLRRGQTSLTIAAPGVGKSQLWNNLAQRMGVPTLYWSADTDQHDILLRTMAMWSGSTISEIDERRDNAASRAFYLEKIVAGSNVDWVFESSITPKGVTERVQAFAELHGEYPHLLVIDNLSNTVQHQAEAFAEEKEVMVAMQRLAREADTHVAILSHAKGEYDAGMKPIPLSGILNNLGKIPEVVLTLHRGDDAGKILCLNLAKNRGGKSDPAAKAALQLPVDYSRAWIGGYSR